VRRAICLLLALAAVATGCGGGDSKPDAAGAQTLVREYLTALVSKDGKAACSKLTPEYQRSVFAQNQAFAKSSGATDCVSLIDKLTHSAPSVSFEGATLTPDTVKKLAFEVKVDGSKATVTGKKKIQQYELVTRDGHWVIAKIARLGG
jgi:limonene-1,2-epoxide hydrolase